MEESLEVNMGMLLTLDILISLGAGGLEISLNSDNSALITPEYAELISKANVDSS